MILFINILLHCLLLLLSLYPDWRVVSHRLLLFQAMFVKKEHFGGAMVWTLDMDDVSGTFCGNGPFPLVHILNELLVQTGK